MSELNQLSEPCPFCESRTCCYILADARIVEVDAKVSRIIQSAYENLSRFGVCNHDCDSREVDNDGIPCKLACTCGLGEALENLRGGINNGA